MAAGARPEGRWPETTETGAGSKRSSTMPARAATSPGRPARLAERINAPAPSAIQTRTGARAPIDGETTNPAQNADADSGRSQALTP
jgi:hypothetical protein